MATGNNKGLNTPNLISQLFFARAMYVKQFN